MTFQGTTFLITGGSAGIGRQMATDLLARGARVLVCGRSQARLDAFAAECPEVLTHACDVRDYDSVLGLRDATARAFDGAPDILINNAAIYRRYDLRDASVPLDDWLRELDINLLGTMRVTHALLPLLIQRGTGTIINLTSPAAYLPQANAPFYSASKAAIHSFTRSLQHQLRESDVSAIQLNPPAVDTQMNAANPEIEGLRLWSVDEFSRTVLDQLASSRRKDILVGDAKLVQRFSRWMPGFVFNKMNPKDRPWPTTAP